MRRIRLKKMEKNEALRVLDRSNKASMEAVKKAEGAWQTKI